MSNYTKATNFASKDTLPVGDANKKVKGSEIDTEFNAISDAIATKADKNSPTFTGTPTAPTAAAGNDSTQLATTAFVAALGALKAPIASPTFTGTPAAPTAAAGTDTTQLATTAFVQQEITANAVADGAITTVKLAADAVTSAKLADNAVGSEHIAANAVGSSEIAASAVGSSEIADNSVTADELNVSGDGTSGQFLSSDGDGSFSWADPTVIAMATSSSINTSSSLTRPAGHTEKNRWISFHTRGSGKTYSIVASGTGASAGFANPGTDYGDGTGGSGIAIWFK